MKKWLLLSFAALLVSPLAQAQTYKLDPAKSKIEWVGKKVTGQHNGSLEVKSGNLTVDQGQIKSGDFVVDMKSIKVLDLQDPAPNAKLTNHLKSDDFFSVETHPETQFKITSAKGTVPGKVDVTGDLTIKGITHPVTIPTTLKQEGDKLSAKGEVKIDRTLYNVKYGSGKFFQGLGDKLISDDFELKLDLYADKAS
ncbi:MAG TPA: YceI family protein [bacterium]|nr:YceI family protein [bacterium]